MTEYGKHGKPRSRLSTFPALLGNPFGITTFPWPRLLAYFEEQQQEKSFGSKLKGFYTARELKRMSLVQSVTDVPVHSPLRKAWFPGWARSA
jgi:hypothetical protein